MKKKKNVTNKQKNIKNQESMFSLMWTPTHGAALQKR